MQFLRRLKYLTFGLGLYQVGKFSYWAGNEFYQRNYCEPSDLISRYGRCYALITGSTSGIGSEYAKQMAKKGFNLVLVSRDENKLREMKNALEVQYAINVVTIPYDFNKADNPDSLNVIYDGVKDLDVGVVINNVGTYVCQKAGYHYPDEIKNLVTVNILPMALLSNHFIPKFLERKEKSCLLTVGSEAGDTPSGYMSVYSATKAFNNTFTRAVEAEIGDRVDIITTTPGPTTTNILKNLAEQRTGTPDISEKIFETLCVSDARDVVRETLNRVGKGENHISGTIKHEVFESLQTTLGSYFYPIKAFIGYNTYDAFGEKRSTNVRPVKPVIQEDTPIFKTSEADESKNSLPSSDSLTTETVPQESNSTKDSTSTTQAKQEEKATYDIYKDLTSLIPKDISRTIVREENKK